MMEIIITTKPLNHNKMKQTAVQWLFEEYKKREIATDEMVELFVKAEQREKEQIIEAYRTGVEEDVYNNPLKTGEQYYNETFKSE